MNRDCRLKPVNWTFRNLVALSSCGDRSPARKFIPTHKGKRLHRCLVSQIELKHGRAPTTTTRQMCAGMAGEDLKIARRHRLLEKDGFDLPVSAGA